MLESERATLIKPRNLGSASQVALNIQHARYLGQLCLLSYDRFGTMLRQSINDHHELDILEWFGIDHEGVEKGSTQAFLAHRGRDLFVTFRGTQRNAQGDQDRRDLLVNVDFRWKFYQRHHPRWQNESLFGFSHAGFSRALDEIWDDLITAIEAFFRQNLEARLWITGHSLGGALATLLAGRLLFCYPEILIHSVHTFGAPRVFGPILARRYAHRIGKRHHRIHVCGDIVPTTPWWIVGFSHGVRPLRIALSDEERKTLTRSQIHRMTFMLGKLSGLDRFAQAA